MTWDENRFFALFFIFQMGWESHENPIKTEISHPMGWEGMGLKKPSHVQP